jgi:hypothetical protein
MLSPAPRYIGVGRRLRSLVDRHRRSPVKSAMGSMGASRRITKTIGELGPARLWDLAMNPWKLRCAPDVSLLEALVRQLPNTTREEKEYPIIDLFYYDSLHTFDRQYFEYRLASEHLRPWELPVSDDILASAVFQGVFREKGSRYSRVRNFGAVRK